MKVYEYKCITTNKKKEIVYAKIIEHNGELYRCTRDACGFEYKEYEKTHINNELIFKTNYKPLEIKEIKKDCELYEKSFFDYFKRKAKEDFEKSEASKKYWESRSEEYAKKQKIKEIEFENITDMESLINYINNYCLLIDDIKIKEILEYKRFIDHLDPENDYQWTAIASVLNYIGIDNKEHSVYESDAHSKRVNDKLILKYLLIKRKIQKNKL